MSEPSEDAFDVVVVGGGIAGAVCAYRLATAGRQVALIERAAQPGAKNLSGGVLYHRVLDDVFPDFVATAPVERRVTRHVLSVLTERSAVSLDYWDARLGEPGNAVTVLRAKLDAWLLERCEEAGVLVLLGVRVDELLREGDRVVGVRAGEDELRARVVVAADGVNSFLARAAGVRPAPQPRQLALGVKSVVALPAEVIEQRFRCRAGEGAAHALLGDATLGCAGGGFLYTNRGSVSAGVVLRLDDLTAKGLEAAAVHDHFLAHPAVAPLLEGGDLLEYGSHLTIEDGPALAAQDATRPGLIVIGDAAGLTLNSGLAIRGMDLAAGSAVVAADAIDRTLDGPDAAEAAPARYRSDLAASFVTADLDTYGRAPDFLATDRLYGAYPALLADVLHGLVRQDATKHASARRIGRDALRRSSVRARDLVRDAWRGVRAL